MRGDTWKRELISGLEGRDSTREGHNGADDVLEVFFDGFISLVSGPEVLFDV